MKYLMFLAMACLLWHPLAAQINTEDNTITNSSDIKGKLVELALQNPNLEISDHQINVAKYQLKETKSWLLNTVSASLNANEFTVKRLQGKTQADGQFYPYYPFYNIGVNIPIGSIFTKPAATKAAKEQVAIATATRESKYREIKAAVLSAYQDYLTNKELLTVKSQITESTYNDYLQAKLKFRNGQISIDDFNKATQQYHDQIISKIAAEHDFNLTKIQLESIIGIPLESVLANFSEDHETIPKDTINTQ